ncbi:hypothetical protein MMC25_008312 [Agyrium rufum]|nr:hypothetical protein [Agyrium rufum]
MPPFRNPFGKKVTTGSGGIYPGQDENQRPTMTGLVPGGGAKPDLANLRASSALSSKSGEEPNEFKLSVVNDSGVYLPPSPTEKKSFWSRTPTSSTVSSHRSMLSENEPFSISRESFDSYRRSFDISARSPIYQPDGATPRQSLDSRTSRPLHTPSSSSTSGSLRIRGQGQAQPLQSSSVYSQQNQQQQNQRPNLDEDPAFEDVDFNAKPTQNNQHPTAAPKRKGLFARFGESSTTEPSSTNNNTGANGQSQQSESRPGSSGLHNFHIMGRKRGQSGQGAELGSILKEKGPVSPGPRAATPTGLSRGAGTAPQQVAPPAIQQGSQQASQQASKQAPQAPQQTAPKTAAAPAAPSAQPPASAGVAATAK